jgi:hypothetical protein
MEQSFLYKLIVAQLVKKLSSPFENKSAQKCLQQPVIRCYF